MAVCVINGTRLLGTPNGNSPINADSCAPIGLKYRRAMVRMGKAEVVNLNIDSTDKPNYYSYGLHPWYIDEFTYDDYIKRLEIKADEKRCIAIGE